MQDLAKKLYSNLKSYPRLRNHLVAIYTHLKSTGNRRYIAGKNNSINIQRSILKNVTFDISGDDNIIEIKQECLLNNVKFFVRGSKHYILIDERCKFNQAGSVWISDSSCSLTIGRNTWIEDVNIGITEPNSKISIGSNCLLAFNIDIRCGDSHSVLDLGSQKRINYAKNIEIQDHVWIAAHTRILKGVSIGRDSIVALGSVVTKSVESNVVVAGNPARIVKTGITWGKELV